MPTPSFTSGSDVTVPASLLEILNDESVETERQKLGYATMPGGVTALSIDASQLGWDLHPRAEAPNRPAWPETFDYAGDHWTRESTEASRRSGGVTAVIYQSGPKRLAVFNEAADPKAPNVKVEAYGLKGFKRTQWRGVFKSAEALNKWAEDNDAEVLGTRDADPGAKVGFGDPMGR